MGDSSGRKYDNQRQTKRKKRKGQKNVLLFAVVLAVLLIAVIVVLAVTKNDSGQKKDADANDVTQTESMEEVTSEDEPSEEETEAPAKPQFIEGTNGQTIYLTFDDGPSDRTYEILDILDEYQVKATFFVLLKEGYEEEYRAIINRGHEIGVHSTSHDYNILYANLDAFIDDVSSCREYVESVTGHHLFLYRFPGGTNNQVHEVSISRCIEYLQSVDLTHFDWNISSGDAAGVTVDKAELVDNLLTRIHENGNSTLVVLAHDANIKSTTTEALREVLPILIQEGYGFSVITRDTPQIDFPAYD